MQVDIVLKNAKVYNMDKADILLGESFGLETDGFDDQEWFANNDPVLTITGSGKNVAVKADAIGKSIIQIEDSGFNRMKTITINVVGTLEQAATLGVTADAAEPK
jgi:hypothetical protein